MKKFLYFILLILISFVLLLSLALASVWDPFSWFVLPDSYETYNSKPISENDFFKPGNDELDGVPATTATTPPGKTTTPSTTPPVNKPVQKAPTIIWRTYNNAFFKFQYPSSYEVSSVSSKFNDQYGTGILFLSTSGNDNLVTITRMLNYGNETGDGAIKKAHPENYNPQNLKHILVDGRTASQYTENYNPTTQSIAMVIDGYIYSIVFDSYPNTTGVQIANQILITFKFTK